MNYFFKFLLPQLLEYFKDDKDLVKDFIPKIIEEKQDKLLLEYKENSNKD